MKIKCPMCDKELPSTYRFYSDLAKHEIHVYADKKTKNLDNRIAF